MGKEKTFVQPYQTDDGFDFDSIKINDYVIGDDIPSFGKITPRQFQMDSYIDFVNYCRYQLNKTKEKLKNGEDAFFEPAVIEAFVSAGKTILLALVANHFKKLNAKVLILTSVGELARQNSEECSNMSIVNSVFSASLGVKSIEHNVVVGTTGTVANHLDDQFSEFIPNAILIDECQDVNWKEVMSLMKDPLYDTKNQYARVLAHFIKENPLVAILGVTGTPYRGIESIMGPFWKTKIGKIIDREFLLDMGYITETRFGAVSAGYDYSSFHDIKFDGIGDFSESQLKDMGDKADVKMTTKIMKEVVYLTRDRLGVLITCASEKHCLQAAESLPEGKWGIITAKTPKDERELLLKKANDGRIKYILQIGCLTTGVNIPYWDTSVILRMIGSLQLLTQLLGRGMRLLKDWHISAGLTKDNHLVLDYSGTLDVMHAAYENVLLDQAVFEMRKKDRVLDIECPRCETLNTSSARRCIGHSISNGVNVRCDYFWVSLECPSCNIENDVNAKSCRGCGVELVDPNKPLDNKHYSEAEWKVVSDMKIGITKNEGIVITLFFENGEKASLFFSPLSSYKARQIWKSKFVNKFADSWKDRRVLGSFRNIQGFLDCKHLIRKPSMATHRISQKTNKSIVHGVKFD